MLIQSLDELLQQCTVRLTSDGRCGTGFFVAPGLILSCAHVVDQASNAIDVFWKSQDKHYKAQIESLLSDRNLDLALLTFDAEGQKHPCALLDNALPRLNDDLYVFGYPIDYSEDYSNGDSVTIRYEGKSFKNETLLLKLKEGQIKEGFSGSPLLNLRTGRVCGIVNISRNTGTDLGGRAIPVTQIFKCLTSLSEVNREFHRRDLRWQKFLPSSSLVNLKRQDVRNRCRLIKAVRANIERWLDVSLPYNQKKINLSKVMRSKLVRRPGDDQFRSFGRAGFPLPSGTSILEIFQKKSVAGRLLILGEPGAGKTVELLELAKQLLEVSESDPTQPIPIPLNLSSWKSEKLEDWLVRELESSGYGISSKAAWRLIKQQQIIPLLDGLDDLNTTQQAKCVGTINKFLSSNYHLDYLVVCCRLDEYTRCFPPLELNDAVYLTALEQEQIEDYLDSTKCSDLIQSIKNDEKLLELARIPLFLFLLISVYSRISPEIWRELKSDQQRQHYLFDNYVEQLLEENNSNKPSFLREPSSSKTRQWLSFLAKNLEDCSEKDFLVEKMQPDWLPEKKQRMFYRLLSGIVSGLTGGIVFVPFGLPLFRPPFSIILFLLMPKFIIMEPMLIVTSALTAGLKKEIKPVETLKFSSKEIIGKIKIRQIFSWAFCILVGYILSLLLNSRIPVIGATVFAGFFSLFQDMLVDNLQGPDIEPDKRSIPNQGIRRSAFNAWILSLIFGATGGMIGGILFFEKCSALDSETLPIHYLLWGERNIAIISSWLGICPNTFIAIMLFAGIGMMGGGLLPASACHQHFALRFVLWLNGYSPWNYTRFLNYATHKGFLKRVGGRYRFIHDLLQKHFAQMEISERLK